MQAQAADGTLEPRTRTLYSTDYGPMFTSLLGHAAVPVDAGDGATRCGDANATNFRYLNHFFEVDQAAVRRRSSTRSCSRYQGIPWVNTIAADSRGTAYYADIGVVPQRDRREGAALQHGARHGDVRGARPAGARRLALGVRLGHATPTPSSPGSSARRRCRRCSATTTSRTPTTATGSRTPRSRWRASRGSSATSAPSARCAPGSG